MYASIDSEEARYSWSCRADLIWCLPRYCTCQDYPCRSLCQKHVTSVPSMGEERNHDCICTTEQMLQDTVLHENIYPVFRKQLWKLIFKLTTQSLFRLFWPNQSWGKMNFLLQSDQNWICNLKDKFALSLIFHPFRRLWWSGNSICPCKSLS